MKPDYVAPRLTGWRRARPWWARALDAVRDIPYVLVDRLSGDEGRFVNAVLALFAVACILAVLLWVADWALRGFAVR